MKPNAQLFIVLTGEIVGVGLMMLGVLPREAALFFTGIFIFFILFSPIKQGLLFTVFSIPFFTALPISESFDMMANWRIIVLFLFSKTLLHLAFSKTPRTRARYVRGGPRNSKPEFRGGRGLGQIGFLRNAMRSKFLPIAVGALETRLGFLVSLFFLTAALSLFVAADFTFGIRKLAYLFNILGLFFVVWAVVRRTADFRDVAKYAFGGVVGATAVGYAQFGAVLFAPLYTFWQWWAQNVIPVFYGAKLGDLLSYSNTWFSYYDDAEPTLRVFSLFPDSHSFALFMILGLPMALVFFFMSGSEVVTYAKQRFTLAKLLALNVNALAPLTAFIVFALLAIIFSGTRGAWVGAVPVASALLLALGILWLRKAGGIHKAFAESKLPEVLKVSIFVFLLLALLFPISSQILQFSQSRQGGKVSSTTIERVSKSLSREELSNYGRIRIWKSTLQSIAAHPILGVGIGNYPVVLGENASATKKGASAHSLYLDVTAEMGIIGGILLILIFLEIFWRALRVALDNKDVFYASFAGFFAVYFLWIMSYSAVDVVLLNDKVLLLFTTLVGLVYAIPKSEVSNQ